MRVKGSITIMLCLMLSVILALFCACFQSAQNAAARAVAVNGGDTAVYSLFGEYDRELLEQYDLFFLDGSYGSGSLTLGKVTERAAYGMEQVLQTDLIHTSVNQCGLTAYCLATDNGGEAFKRQAACWARDSLDGQALSYLLNQAGADGDRVRSLEEQGENLKDGEQLEAYDRMVEDSRTDPEGEEEETTAVQPPAELPDAENPIEVFRKVRNMGVLGLVLPGGQHLSEKGADLSSFLSHRTRNQGMGNSRGSMEGMGMDDLLLYQEYVLQKLGNYTRPNETSDLAYQLEYVLAGGDRDEENLKKVVHRLLVIREAANYGAIYSDPVKRKQAAALGLSLASAAGIPAGQQIAEALVILCWAYGESLLDVRGLLAGGKVPVVKNQEQWQLSLSNLPHILEVLQGEEEAGTEGLDYQGYLRILLYVNLEKEEKEVYRCMDMVENVIRKHEGKQGFRLDCCLESAEVEWSLIGPGKQRWNLVRSYGYDMRGE